MRNRLLYPRKRGQAVERLAERHLRQAGLKLIIRNYLCRCGEIDLIMQDRDKLVFVEVRYRHNKAFGSGEETVDRHKQNRIIRSAMHFLQRHPGYNDMPMRFDVVGVHGELQHQPEINWLTDAFAAF